ncbi:MAG: hypothetical protein E6I93_03305 [Chloroflexi bacterium]|nr:MAG: hypothetical protein E6I93_03305 [Chloroflexota bacterium]
MGGTARCTPVDGQTRNEKIGTTTDPGGRDALRHGPVDAIGRGDYHEIIGPYGCAAGRFKPAVIPDDIHSARLVNLSSWERSRTNIAGITIEEDLCSKDRLLPGCTTIGGPDGQDRRLKTIVDGDDDRSIGLHKWLPANDTGVVGSRLGCSPRQPTISRGAHLDGVEATRIVELGIAVAKERATGCIITDRPVFVVKMTGSIYHDGGAKCQSAISRTTYKHIDRSGARILNAQPGDHPDLVPGIVGDRSVTGTEIFSRRCRIDGRVPQEAFGPGFAGIGRSRKTNVGCSTIEETARLEGGHDGVAKGKGVRLDLRLVITIGVGIRVTTYLGELFSCTMHR